MIIDFHAYVGRSILGYRQDPGKLLKTMEETGIEAAVICPVKSLDPFFASQNEFMATLQETYRGKMFGFARIDPNLGQAAVLLLHEAIAGLKLKGLVLHPWEETFAINDQKVFPFIEVAEHFRIPVMIETGYPWVSHCFQVGELAKRFRSTRFIMTHGGQLDSSGYSLTDAAYVLNNSPNIIMETSGVFADELIENTALQLGPDRLVFGSHSPWLDVRLELVKICRTHLPEEIKKQVLGGTAARLLGLEGGCG